MYRTATILSLTLTLVPLLGCGTATTPEASPLPPVAPPVQRIDPAVLPPPWPIQKQVTVMGKNGPENITITETLGSSIQKLPRLPTGNISSLPPDPGEPEFIRVRPKSKDD